MELTIKSRRVKIAFAILCLTAVVAIFSGGANSVAAQTIPTATASILQFPTATLTQLGGPTATPSRTPTLTPVSAQALGTPTNLRSGPGLNFDIVGVLSTGDTVPIIGRSVTFPWYVVAWAEGPNGQAWVFAQLIQVIGDITTVPVIDPPEVPTTDPTRAILDATATAILQTPGGAETVTAQAFFLPTGIYTVTPGAGYGGGILPTFTPPPPIDQLDALPPPPAAGGGIAPAVIIIALGALGLLMLGLGLLRRMF
jgi:SH3 domain-containing protein